LATRTEGHLYPVVQGLGLQGFETKQQEVKEVGDLLMNRGFRGVPSSDSASPLFQQKLFASFSISPPTVHWDMEKPLLRIASVDK